MRFKNKQKLKTMLQSYNSSKEQYLNKWIEWRYQQVQDEEQSNSPVKPRYSPESPMYESQLRSSAMKYYVLSILLAGACIIYYVYLYHIKKDQGKLGQKESQQQFSQNYSQNKIIQYNALIISTLGLIVFLVGAIITINGIYYHREQVWQTSDNLRNISKQMISNTQEIDSIINVLNNQSLTDPINITNSISLNITNQVGQILKNNLQVQESSSKLANKIDYQEQKIFQGSWAIVMISISLILLNIIIYSFLQGNYVFKMGFVFILLSSYSLWFLGNMYMIQLETIDFCEQISLIRQGIIPPYGYGISYYFPCSSQSNQIMITQQKYKLYEALNQSYTYLQHRLNATGQSQLLKNQTNVTSLTQYLIQNQASQNDQVVVQQNQVAFVLQKAIQRVERLSHCYYQWKFAQQTQSTMCYFGLNFLDDVFSGISTMLWSLFILAIGSIQMKGLIERVKSNDNIDIPFWLKKRDFRNQMIAEL